MKREHRTLLIQSGLFVATLITTTLAGAEWTYGKSIYIPGYQWSDFVSGFSFSIPFLLIFTVHEFGHYFTARYHSVSATLPYYIPLPPIPFSIGTMGALIRLRQRIYSKQQEFDIGISGPLAGFTMALLILFYGFMNLPEPEYIFSIHPEYEEYGLNYAKEVYSTPSDKIIDVVVGQNLLFLFFEKFVAEPDRMPNAHEIMHYPILFAGFLSLMFTSLNLLPIGQLDGGRVVHGLFGTKVHGVIARVTFLGLLFYSCVGVIDLHDAPENLVFWITGGALFLYLVLLGLGLSKRDTIIYALLILASLILISYLFPTVHGYSGWIVFVFLIGRFIGVQIPPLEIEEPLDTKRIVLGWIALIVFAICFSPSPLN